MKLIQELNVRKFISELDDIFYALHVGDETWHKYNAIAELYFGEKIKFKADEITEEIAIIWQLEDVQRMRSDLTNAQASDVLAYLEKNHNAEDGINWGTIEIVANILFPLDTH